MPKARPRKLTPDDVEIEESEVERSAELEVLDFLDGLGPQGISEVSLYRVFPNGRQKFICSGPPSQFSELYVQTTYGGGDYLVRAKLNGKWYRSKSFSVENPGVTWQANGGNGNGHSNESEIERLRLQIQEQQIRMDAERAASLQRAHEFQLALIQHGGGGGAPQMTIADMVSAVKNLNDMGGQDQIDKAIERIFSLATKVQQLQGGGASSGDGGGWWDWAKPIVGEAGKQLLPRLVPFFGNAQQPGPPTAPPAAAPATVPPGLPEPSVSQATTAMGGTGDTAPQPTMTEEQNEAAYQAQKREALGFAIAMARMQRDPSVWGTFAVEQIETHGNPVTTRFVQEIVKAEKFDIWFAELEKMEPSVITQRGWFSEFFDCIREIVNQKEAENPE